MSFVTPPFRPTWRGERGRGRSRPEVRGGAPGAPYAGAGPATHKWTWTSSAGARGPGCRGRPRRRTPGGTTGIEAPVAGPNPPHTRDDGGATILWRVGGDGHKRGPRTVETAGRRARLGKRLRTPAPGPAPFPLPWPGTTLVQNETTLPHK